MCYDHSLVLVHDLKVGIDDLAFVLRLGLRSGDIGACAGHAAHVGHATGTGGAGSCGGSGLVGGGEEFFDLFDNT